MRAALRWAVDKAGLGLRPVAMRTKTGRVGVPCGVRPPAYGGRAVGKVHPAQGVGVTGWTSIATFSMGSIGDCPLLPDIDVHMYMAHAEGVCGISRYEEQESCFADFVHDLYE